MNLDEVANIAIRLLDLTSLSGSEEASDIEALCRNAQTPVGETAAVCVYPKFVSVAKEALSQANAQSVKVATVSNFPDGNDDIDTAIAEINAAIQNGADEVDTVLPYKTLLADDEETVKRYLAACRGTCGSNVALKVILETGKLKTPDRIEQASRLAILAGADFIKTSTGKTPAGATLAAARIMLLIIKYYGGNCGLKVSGGIRTPKDAESYLKLAESIMGSDFLVPEKFRIGASSILKPLLAASSLK